MLGPCSDPGFGWLSSWLHAAGGGQLGGEACRRHLGMSTRPILTQSALERAQHAIRGRLTVATFDDAKKWT